MNLEVWVESRSGLAESPIAVTDKADFVYHLKSGVFTGATSGLSLLAPAGAGTSRLGAARLVDTVFDTISRELREGESVTISGFGTFEVKARKARQGRNPRAPGNCPPGGQGIAGAAEK